ncbi:MAG: AAA family ATPase [Deltaproteobacteria bacterium]|nr:AAA family ATPase [Deltaproteobacteria bacterium]
MARTRRASRAPVSLPAFVEYDLLAQPPASRLAFGNQEHVASLSALIEGPGPHPVLVGPHGCGKSSVVRGLALAMEQGARPRGASAIWRFSLQTIEALTRKEMALVPALNELVMAAATARSSPLLWCHDVHLARVFDVHAVLALLLQRAGVRLVGEAPPPFDRQCLEDSELSPHFRPYLLSAASSKQTEQLLLVARAALRAQGVRVHRAAVARIVERSAHVLADCAQPGRAMTLLHWCLQAGSLERPIGASRVDRVLRQSVALAPILLKKSKSIAETLDRTVLGQSPVNAAIEARIALWRAGMNLPRRPAASMLLAGPPSVGKTSLARATARVVLGKSARTIELFAADYAEDWKVDQLIGQRGAATADLKRGSLASSVRGRTVSVLIIDEIERAHVSLLRWLVKVMGDGGYVNGADERISLANTLLILTTNAGADAYRERPVGMGPEATQSHRMHALSRAISTFFAPELLERVDLFAVLQPLDSAVRAALVTKWVQTGLNAWQKRNAQTLQLEGVELASDHLASMSGDVRVLRARAEREILSSLMKLEPSLKRARLHVEQGAVVLRGER